MNDEIGNLEYHSMTFSRGSHRKFGKTKLHIGGICREHDHNMLLTLEATENSGVQFDIEVEIPAKEAEMIYERIKEYLKI